MAHNGEGWCGSWLQNGDIVKKEGVSIASFLDEDGLFTLSVWLKGEEVLVVQGDIERGVLGYAEST